MAALAEQDYPNLFISLVHDDGDGALLERHSSSLHNVELVESPVGAGFGEKVNLVLATADEPLLLIHHDDVAMQPGTVSALVREWLRRREPRSLVAAKLLDWHEPAQLMPAGFDADRFGATASLVRPGDIDQGQQDRIADIFGTSTACVLIDKAFLAALGGFDQAIDWHGESFDLAARARSVGGQVVIVPNAVARHRAAFEARDGTSSTFRLRRHQMRAVLASASALSIPGLLLGFAALHIAEFVVALARFDLREAAAIPAAWLWNLTKAGSLLSRRRELVTNDQFDPDNLKLIRRRGTLRVAESVDRRIHQREVAAETGEDTISAVRTGGGIAIGVLLAFGARHLITRPIPEVGEFRALPDDLGTLTSDWWSGFRVFAMGGDGFASFLLPILDVLGLLALGSDEILRKVLLIAPIPIGVIGAWKLFSRSRSDYAPVVAAGLFAASPLAYNAIAGGSLIALVLFALMPWILGNVIALAGNDSIGFDRSPRAATAALAFLLAIAVALRPGISLLMVAVLIGIVLGSLLSGDMRGIVRIVSRTLVATGVAILVNLPAILTAGSWDFLVSAQTGDATATPLADLLVLDTGPEDVASAFELPVASVSLGWAFFAPAVFPLISGTGQRFTWALRIWGAMLVTWGVAWAAARGWLPLGLPVAEVTLVPIATGFAFLGGIGGLVIDSDVAAAKARRGIPAAIAVVGTCLALLGLVSSTSTGRWNLARADLSTTYSALEEDADEGVYRVLWVGDAHVLGAAAIPTDNGLAWSTSLNGVPDIRALWGAEPGAATNALGAVVSDGLNGQTSRLGRQLAPYGVRYIVVMDQQAPVPSPSRRTVASEIRAAGLNGQLDLVADGVVNPAVVVYRNTAWSPVHSALAPEALDERQFNDAAPAIVERSGHGHFVGQTRLERNVFVSWEPSTQWTLAVDDQVVPRIDVGTDGMAFETAGLTGTAASLAYETSGSHRLIVVLQVVGWIVLIASRRWLVGETRREQRTAAARVERVG